MDKKTAHIREQIRGLRRFSPWLGQDKGVSSLPRSILFSPLPNFT